MAPFDWITADGIIQILYLVLVIFYVAQAVTDPMIVFGINISVLLAIGWIIVWGYGWRSRADGTEDE